MERIVGLLPEPWSAVVLAVLAGSAIALWRLGNEGATVDALVARVRRRFLLGVPWGTLTVIGCLLAVYLFVQDGITAWDRPVAYPFIAWSYFYPLGQLAAGFAHANPGHLLANLLGTAVFGTLAEYAWGHYPNERSPWPTRPWVRAFVVVPVAAALAALVTTTFAWGSVIGFSGVVFAFLGVAVVRYPIVTVIASVAQTAIVVVGRALFDPVVVHEVTGGADPPGWAGVAFQGHALGFIIGAIVGIGLLYRREPPDAPGPLRIWLGATLIAATMGLWTVWTSQADDVFVLYRGVGVAGVLILATALAAASRAGASPIAMGVTGRHLAVAALCLPVLAMGVVAIPMGLSTVGPYDPPSEHVAVADYEVSYEVDRQMVWRPGINVSAVADSTTTRTRSGLFVASQSRELHIRVSSSDELAREGGANVTLGGPGWREEIEVDRSGWTPAGNDSVYRVEAVYDGERHTLYTAPAREADARIDERRIAIAATDDGFAVRVIAPSGGFEEVRMPASDESVSTDGLSFRREGEDLVAAANGTRVVIASED